MAQEIIAYVYVWGSLNIALRYFSNGLISDKNDSVRFAKYTISFIATLAYLYTFNMNMILGYYYYSSVLVIKDRNFLFLLHHAGSIICGSVSPDHHDHGTILMAFYWLKLGDLFSYPTKIIENTYFAYTNENAALVIMEWSMFIHLIMSFVYRIIIPLQAYQVLTTPFYVIGVAFHIANVWWWYKTYKKFLKIAENAFLTTIIEFMGHDRATTSDTESAFSESDSYSETSDEFNNCG